MSVFDLWLPILLAGLATHILSTLFWTVSPHHRPEWNRLPDEDEFQDWLVKHNVASNQFIFPCTYDGAEAKCEAFQQKQNKCRGLLILWDQPTNMGKAIGQTLAYFFVAAFVLGYLASLALPAGAPFMRVLQFVMTAGLLAYCAAHFPHVFWFRRRIARELIDGVVFAAATGLIFAALWPTAV